MEKISKKQVEGILRDWYNYLMEENDGVLREEEIYLYTEKHYGKDDEDAKKKCDDGNH